MIESLPHFNAACNVVITTLLLCGFVAIKRGERVLHQRFMLSAVSVGVIFLIGYVVMTVSLGHQRFPGDDWVRKLFLAILLTHTFLAVTVVPLILRAVYLAINDRIAQHRRLVTFTFPIWIYVSVTGLLIYWMNNHLRPS